MYITGPGTTLDIDGATFYQNIAYGGTGGDIDEEGPATGGSATGGALCIQGIHQADIRDSLIFIYNHALGTYGALNGGFALGGGLAVFGSDVALTDCLVANNEAIGSPNDHDEDPDPSFGYGGGIYADAALVSLTNTDVEDNDASTDGDDLYGDDFGP